MATPAPPTPAPAAPPPPSQRGPVTGFDNLRASLRSAIDSYSQPAPEPSPATETPAPASNAAPAPSSEPAAPSEGSTPKDSAPAPSAEPAASAAESWISRYGSQERAAQEAFALEQRAAAMAKRLKELEGSPQATPQPAQPEPVAAAQPAAEPEHPATPQAQPQPTPPQEDLQAVALRLADADSVCVDLDRQFVADETRLKELDQEIPKVASEIAYLQRRVQELKDDPLQAEEEQRKLDRQQLQHERLGTERLKLDLRKDSLQEKWRQRLASIHGHLTARAEAQAREAESRQQTVQEATVFARSVGETFLREFEAGKYDPEVRGDVWESVKARAALVGYQIPDPTAFVRTVLQTEKQRMERFHRVESRRFALTHAPVDVPPPTAPAQTAPAIPARSPASIDPAAQFDGLRLRLRQSARIPRR